MSTISKEEFFRALKHSRLLTPAQLQAVHKAARDSDDVAKIAKHLCRRDWITTWQAQNLLAARSRFQLGQYTLLDVLGRGRMGTVFRARHVATGRIVALKRMSAEITNDPRMVARFRREIRLISSLRHPNIVSAIDAGEADGRYFLVTELVFGHDLFQWMKRERRLPVDWICECIRGGSVGLQHIYERGMIHRDIKPSNLMVTAESVAAVPRVKILDLGLSRVIDHDDGEQLTRDGHTVGSIDFMAPERFQTGQEIDIRSDIYAFGCTLFQALTLRLPFETDNLAEKLTSKMTKEPPRLDQLRPDVPKELGDIVTWMLHPAPEKRPALPRDVAEALAPFSMGTKSRVIQSVVPKQTEPEPAVIADAPSETPEVSSSINGNGQGAHRKFSWIRSLWSRFHIPFRRGRGMVGESHPTDDTPPIAPPKSRRQKTPQKTG